MTPPDHDRLFDAIFPVITATIVGARGVDPNSLVRAQPGGERRDLLWQIRAGRPAADHDRLAGGVPLCTHSRGGYRNGDGRLWARRRDDDGVALCRFPRRFAGILEIAMVGYMLVKAMSVAASSPAALASRDDGAEYGAPAFATRRNSRHSSIRENDSISLASWRYHVAASAPCASHLLHWVWRPLRRGCCAGTRSRERVHRHRNPALQRHLRQHARLRGPATVTYNYLIRIADGIAQADVSREVEAITTMGPGDAAASHSFSGRIARPDKHNFAQIS